MANETDLRPGDPGEIAGYRVVRRLGSGGQGVVYLATDSSGERVAIKQLRFDTYDERARQQFAKEVAAARLVAPFCTAQVLDVDLEAAVPYVVSEYIEGLSLQQRIGDHGPIQGAPLQRLAIGTVVALAAIHQAGVVHRDFKPANVMLASDGPRVIDFGIARDLSAQATTTSRIFGTPAYMAPEQLRAEGVGPATDMFAWASVVTFAASGRVPFEAPHMMAIAQRISSGEPDLTGVPADLLEVIRHCLEKDPVQRPSAVQVLARLLGRPSPEPDTVDQSTILAEATGLVHAAAVTSTMPSASGLPTLEELSATREDGTTPIEAVVTSLDEAPSVPPARDTSVAAVPTAVQGGPAAVTAQVQPGPSRRPGSHPGRASALAAGLLVLVVGSVWALGQYGPFDRSSDAPTSPGARPSGVASQGAGAAPSTSASPPSPSTSAAKVPVQADNGAGGVGGVDSASGEDKDSIPKKFAGTWEGRVRQPRAVAKNWTARLDLVAGKTTGRIRLLAGLDCAGKLTFTSVSINELKLVSVMDVDPKNRCATIGQVRLTLYSPDRVAFYWEDASDSTNRATGILRRK